MGGTHLHKKLGYMSENQRRQLAHLHPPPAISTLFPLERKKFSLSNKETGGEELHKGLLLADTKGILLPRNFKDLGKNGLVFVHSWK